MRLRAKVMSRLVRHAGFRLFRFFSRSVDGNAATGSPPMASLRSMDEAEVVALCSDPELDLREDSIKAAFQRGDLCVGAFDGGTLAGYCWLAFSPIPHLDGVFIEFSDDVVWTYKSLVRHSHRGRGIAPALYRHADAACLQRSRCRSLICVESHNVPSISAALRAGYQNAGSAAYVRRGSFFADWYAPGLVQHYGVSFFVPDWRPDAASP